MILPQIVKDDPNASYQARGTENHKGTRTIRGYVSTNLSAGIILIFIASTANIG